MFQDKNALVTGAAGGIGQAIVKQLRAQGARVAVADRATNGIEAEAHLPGDLLDPAYCDQLAANAQQALGGLDIVINNAGIWHKAGPLDSISEEMLMAPVQTNLTGLMQLTRHLLPALRDRGEAAILNVASKSGVVAQAGQSVYTATKYGVRGFTDVLKVDEAETGVRVAGLYQSGTNTGMFAKAGEDVPNHIFTEPEDLADVVVFMLSRPPKLWMHEVRVEL
jgi:NAD(P)-dependent dehydrogenase (short-subunit alcohol dehydrogenase family)